MAEQKPPLNITLAKVRHTRTGIVGRAIEFNENPTDPAYWVEWPDKSANWYAVDDLEVVDAAAN